MKEVIEKLWEDVFVKWRQLKYKVCREYLSANRITTFYKTSNKQKICNEYNNVSQEYKKLLKKMDEDILNNFKKDGSMLSWVKSEFVNAVVKNTNYFIDREINNDNTLYTMEEKKNNKMIYIVQKLKNDLDEENLNNNIEIIQVEDKIEYKVKGITLFTDSTQKQEQNKLYHGTTLMNAQNIYSTGKLLSKRYDNVEAIYNKDKIFLTTSVNDSIQYAKRNFTDDIHIVFEFDTSGIKLYERQHMISEREGRLFFAQQEELNIKDRILNIYMLKNDKIEEITINEMMKDRDDFDNYINKFANVKKGYIKSVKENEQIKNTIKQNITQLANMLNISEKESAKILLKHHPDVYNELFENRKTFNNIYEHFNYLRENNLKDKQYIPKISLNNIKIMYHGTSIGACKNIIKSGYIKTDKEHIDKISYNKVFFSDNVNYAKTYGMMGGAMGVYNVSTKYIVLECDLNGYDVFSYYIHNEFFVWGDVKTDCIKHIWLVEDDIIKREISKDELINGGIE